MPEPRAAEVSQQRGHSGPHRVLLAFYAIFVLAAGARSAVQLATAADRAPVAYSLSAVAACTYAAGWVAIRRASAGSTGLASVMLWVELLGVVAVGTLSLVRPELFPDASVWSQYGIGYGFVPAVLPLAGLYWLHRQKQSLARVDPR
jgi:4-amino-4-deoxy-L-arabinose transferase-like glycosyltransferase